VEIEPQKSADFRATIGDVARHLRRAAVVASCGPVPLALAVVVCD
jgi:hypothetical protein